MSRSKNKKSIDICLDEIAVAQEKLKSIKTKDNRVVFEGWIRKQKQTLKEFGYKKRIKRIKRKK